MEQERQLVLFSKSSLDSKLEIILWTGFLFVRYVFLMHYSGCANHISNSKVLLTKSKYLSTKLKNYMCNLFESQMPEKYSQDKLEEDKVSGVGDETTKKETIVSLEKRSFPLVRTFDEFVELIENTVRSVIYGYFCRLLITFNNIFGLSKDGG